MDIQPLTVFANILFQHDFALTQELHIIILHQFQRQSLYLMLQRLSCNGGHDALTQIGVEGDAQFREVFLLRQF